MSLKDKIKSAQDIQKQLVVVDEWNGIAIEVRTMTALQRTQILKECTDKDGDIIHTRFQASLLIACCFDPETGEVLFTNEDSDWLMSKSAGPIEKLASAALAVSGLNKEAVKKAEKNS